MFEKHKDTSLLVHILVCLFGIGAWVGTNGILIELPILVERLPERWNLASYLVIAIQLANIGPLLYTVAHLLFPRWVYEKPFAYVIIVLAALCCLLLIFLWQQTTEVGGVEHSTILLVLLFFLAMANCTSSVVFLPFMAQLKTSYMTSFYIGQGLSSLLPSMVALGQGAGAMSCQNRSQGNVTLLGENLTTFYMEAEYYPPRFPPREFFGFIFVTMVICGLAFVLLNHLSVCKNERVEAKDPIPDEQEKAPEKLSVVYQADLKPESVCQDGIPQNDSRGESAGCWSKVKSCFSNCSSESTMGYFLLLTVNGWINALENGIIPSIQSYAYLPYGNQPYHLALVFANVADPTVCFLAFFLPTTSKRLVTVFMILATAASSYIITLASMSPDPFMVEDNLGDIVAVGAQVIATSFLTYSKLSIAAIFRERGGKSLLWYGAVTQLGSLIGALVTFYLVNVLNVFVAAPPCRGES
ncbi:solute carrier family 52, riboflavin transporter, member 3-B-like [Liolophura sinensis]|uniref:solute carrier family 52, riboflavin transporter, member 3-B-like n=1 Tax=Liolophura sinensis TaxID=3198878 RepID=UPI0031593795